MDSKNLTNRPRLDLIIDEIYREKHKEEQKDRSYHPRVSQAGSCACALSYKALGAPGKEMSGRTARLLRNGHAIEDVTIASLSESEKLDIHSRQLGVNVARISNAHTDEDIYCETCEANYSYNMLHGHIDGLIQYEGETYLVDIKGLGDFGFSNLDNEPPLGYIEQQCCYLVGLKKLGIDISKALLFCKNKNNDDFRQIYIEYNHEFDTANVINEWDQRMTFVEGVVAGVIELHEQVEEVIKNGILAMPKRPYTMDHWKCRVCEYNSACWDGYPDELKYSITEQSLESSDPLGFAIIEFSEYKAQKSELEKKLKSLRQFIVTELSRRDIKSGMVNGVPFSLMGKRKGWVDHSLIPINQIEDATKTKVIQTLKVGSSED